MFGNIEMPNNRIGIFMILNIFVKSIKQSDYIFLGTVVPQYKVILSVWLPACRLQLATGFPLAEQQSSSNQSTLIGRWTN